jgi:small subunit ribosomal protein S14
MAKKSIIARDLKRQKMIEKYASKRAELKAAGDWEGLAKLPRNSSPTRLRIVVRKPVDHEHICVDSD